MFNCKACEVKDSVIADLKEKRDLVDTTKDKWIADLQKQVAYLQGEVEKYRKEAKRATDLLLMKNNTAPVSDMANPVQQMPFDPMAAFENMFEDEIVKKRKEETEEAET